MELDYDVERDLNAQDDDGRVWSALTDAWDPPRAALRVMLLAGNRFGRAVVQVVAVDDDGQVHLKILPARSRRTATSLAGPWHEVDRTYLLHPSARASPELHGLDTTPNQRGSAEWARHGQVLRRDGSGTRNARFPASASDRSVRTSTAQGA